MVKDARLSPLYREGFPPGENELNPLGKPLL